jgi:hypothetical protein
MRRIAKSAGLEPLEVLAMNLSYEVAGTGCVSAAVYNRELETYELYRQLEWSVPDFVTTRLAQSRDLHFTQISGYVGMFDGVVPEAAISMNLPPDYCEQDINVFGTPVSWVIRELLTTNSKEDMVTRLLKAPAVVRPAWLNVVGKQSASIVRLNTDGKHVVHKTVEAPETLVICNDWEIDPDVVSAVEKYMASRTPHIPRLSRAMDTGAVLSSRSAVVYSVVYRP